MFALWTICLVNELVQWWIHEELEKSFYQHLFHFLDFCFCYMVKIMAAPYNSDVNVTANESTTVPSFLRRNHAQRINEKTLVSWKLYIWHISKLTAIARRAEKKRRLSTASNSYWFIFFAFLISYAIEIVCWVISGF